MIAKFRLQQFFLVLAQIFADFAKTIEPPTNLEGRQDLPKSIHFQVFGGPAKLPDEKGEVKEYHYGLALMLTEDPSKVNQFLQDATRYLEMSTGTKPPRDFTQRWYGRRAKG